MSLAGTATIQAIKYRLRDSYQQLMSFPGACYAALSLVPFPMGLRLPGPASRQVCFYSTKPTHQGCVTRHVRIRAFAATKAVRLHRSMQVAEDYFDASQLNMRVLASTNFARSSTSQTVEIRIKATYLRFVAMLKLHILTAFVLSAIMQQLPPVILMGGTVPLSLPRVTLLDQLQAVIPQLCIVSCTRQTKSAFVYHAVIFD